MKVLNNILEVSIVGQGKCLSLILRRFEAGEDEPVWSSLKRTQYPKFLILLRSTPREILQWYWRGFSTAVKLYTSREHSCLEKPLLEHSLTGNMKAFLPLLSYQGLLTVIVALHSMIHDTDGQKWLWSKRSSEIPTIMYPQENILE